MCSTEFVVVLNVFASSSTLVFTLCHNSYCKVCEVLDFYVFLLFCSFIVVYLLYRHLFQSSYLFQAPFLQCPQKLLSFWVTECWTNPLEDGIDTSGVIAEAMIAVVSIANTAVYYQSPPFCGVPERKCFFLYCLNAHRLNALFSAG